MSVWALSYLLNGISGNTCTKDYIFCQLRTVQEVMLVLGYYVRLFSVICTPLPSSFNTTLTMSILVIN